MKIYQCDEKELNQISPLDLHDAEPSHLHNSWVLEHLDQLVLCQYYMPTILENQVQNSE